MKSPDEFQGANDFKDQLIYNLSLREDIDEASKKMVEFEAQQLLRLFSDELGKYLEEWAKEIR